MQLRSALLAATILGLPLTANAQPVTGLYVGVGAGVNFTQKENATLSRPAAEGPLAGSFSTSGDLNGSAGFAGVLSLGWGFGNGLRAEVEGNYRKNQNDGTSGFGFGGSSISIAGGSTQQTYGGMVNVLYDFTTLAPWVQPYVGVGVGGVAISEKYHFYNPSGFSVGALGVPGGAISAANSGGTKASFAYQAILGAAFPLNQVLPGLALTTEYRFLGTAGDRDYSGTGTLRSASGATVATTPVNLKLGPIYNHAILIGLRYNFGAAPPPPPPPPVAAPAPAPARSYLVFFDWDKATLSDRARGIIKEAADNSTRVQYTRIEVNGYTDTSGTPRYNQGLSVRRAQAVQAELVRDGVPANAITIQGFGDTHLLVPTGPGVREPQNRRVEIIIR